MVQSLHCCSLKTTRTCWLSPRHGRQGLAAVNRSRRSEFGGLAGHIPTKSNKLNSTAALAAINCECRTRVKYGQLFPSPPKPPRLHVWMDGQAFSALSGRNDSTKILWRSRLSSWHNDELHRRMKTRTNISLLCSLLLSV